jgi:hypothetical protein
MISFLNECRQIQSFKAIAIRTNGERVLKAISKIQFVVKSAGFCLVPSGEIGL